MEAMEYKCVPISGFKADGENTGVIDAFVSVTGIRDRVADVIEPKAYEETLTLRTPKGVWHHHMDQPVSRTLDVKELLPGDSRLPSKMSSGSPWPRDAGAAFVRTEFNLETQRGRDAFSDVKFFGDDQEWSIGYSVPDGGSKFSNGVRHIKTLNWFEYSPVLFGAMPEARTAAGVKAAQIAYKSLLAAELGESDMSNAETMALLEKAIEKLDTLIEAVSVKSDSGLYVPEGTPKSFGLVDTIKDIFGPRTAALLSAVQFEKAADAGDADGMTDHAERLLIGISELPEAKSGEDHIRIGSVIGYLEDVLVKMGAISDGEDDMADEEDDAEEPMDEEEDAPDMGKDKKSDEEVLNIKDLFAW